MRKIGQLLFIWIFAQFMTFCSSPEPEKKPVLNISSAKIDSSGKLICDLKPSQDSGHSLKSAQIDNVLQKAVKAKLFNGAVLVAEDNRIIYSNAFGYSNYEKKTPLTVHSSFHLASVSKQFTAMAIMILKEEGKLNYDDDIKKFIPEIPYEGVTVRHLLTHTSGIPNILNYIPNFMLYWDSCQIASNSDVVYMLAKHKPRLSFKPGHRFSYNNTGYVLLAVIIENITKKPYGDFIEKKIFTPLRMDDSKIYSLVSEPVIKERAYGYGVNRSYYSLDEDDIRNGLTGEKGVYSSVIDLFKWDQALYTNFLVKDSTLMEAFVPASLFNGKKIRYGFGWRQSKDNDNVIYHFGHWRGFNTCIIRFTQDKKLIVILNNTGNKKVKYLAREIMKILYPDKDNIPDL